MTGYERLANAIVIQAAEDYRDALADRKKDPIQSAKDIKELESFFRSGWFRLLTEADPDYLIKKHREEVGK